MFDKKFFLKYFELVLYSIIFIIPLIFTTLTKDNYEFVKTTVLHLSLSVSIILLLIKTIVTNKKVTIRYNKNLILPLLILLPILIINIYFSKHVIETWKSIYFFIVFILLYFIISISNSKRSDYKIITILLIDLFLISFYAILQKYNITIGNWTGDVKHRPFSTLANPDFLGSYLGIGIPVIIYAFIKNVHKRKIPFYLIIIVTFITFIALIFTKTMTIYIALLLAGILTLLFVLINAKQQLKKALILIICFVILIGLFHKPLIKKIEQKRGSVINRLLMWHTGMKMFRDNPVTGIGMGAVKIFYPVYQGIMLHTVIFESFSVGRADYLHNEFVHFLTESGFILSGIILLFITVLLKQILKVKQMNRYILLFIYLIVFFDSMGAFPLRFVSYNLILIVYIHLFLPYNSRISFNIKKYVAIPIIILLIIFISLIIVRQFQSDIYRKQGYIYQIASQKYSKEKTYPESIKLRTRSLELNPLDNYDRMNYYNIGIMYKELNKIDLSQNYFKKVLSYNPGIVAAYYELANLYRIKNNYNLALQNYYKSYYIRPNMDIFFKKIFRLHAKNNNVTGIKTIVKKMFLQYKHSKKLLFSAANEMFNISNYELSKKIFRFLINNNYYKSESYYILAQIDIKQANYTGAKQYLKKSLNNNPNYLPAQKLLNEIQ